MGSGQGVGIVGGGITSDLATIQPERMDACLGRRACISFDSPAFFTWLGVVPYLTQDAIGRTLDYMSSIQDSEVVFDYIKPPEAFSEELRQLETERTEQLKKINERSVSRFEPAGIAAILRSHGFCAIEDINFQEIVSRFGRAIQGLAPGHAGVHVVHAKH
jgi:O-methyltransferase involved in polyketide biosynthesis